jgi:hypothetical protein
LINAKDDEPEWVRDYYRKAVQMSLLAVGIEAAVSFTGGHLFSGWRDAFYLGGFIPIIVVGLWVRHAYPPVRAWKEAWLNEHQIRRKEDSRHA